MPGSHGSGPSWVLWARRWGGLEPGRYRMWVQKEGYLDLPCTFDLTEKDQAVPEMRFYRKPATA